MNMILFGDGHSGVEQGDSLQIRPQRQYDCVLSNIPFSLDVSADSLKLLDASARDADEACLLHCWNSVKPGGKGAVVLPEGLVVNEGHGGLWDRIYSESRVRVIATLPRGTFAPYTEAGTKILYFTDKGRKRTKWFYQASIAGPKTRGETIDRDEFLFFYRDSDSPSDECPAGIEVVRPKANRPWRVPSGRATVPLESIASISNGQSITEETAVRGSIPVVAGGRVSSYTHNRSNADGGCFTISKSGANSGYAW